MFYRKKTYLRAAYVNISRPSLNVDNRGLIYAQFQLDLFRYGPWMNLTSLSLQIFKDQTIISQARNT